MMKRIHIHVSVEDLAESIRFYNAIFGGVEPTVRKEDYCKWELNDPAVNFAISRCLARSGIDHFGIQVETEEELTDMQDRLLQAEFAADGMVPRSGHAVLDRSWTVDPQGVAWEAFLTPESATTQEKAQSEHKGPSPSSPRHALQPSVNTVPFRRRR
jgi:catechol 2,3-dioxygenase-like lactoylglutathione lyase family enzyme